MVAVTARSSTRPDPRTCVGVDDESEKREIVSVSYEVEQIVLPDSDCQVVLETPDQILFRRQSSSWVVLHCCPRSNSSPLD
jgi:hypothetical protein